MLPRDPAVVRAGRLRRGDRRTARSAARCRSPATSATSRRPPSARSASRPARPRTPTAPATSCCSTPAPSSSGRSTACSPRSATSSATSAPVYALEGSIAVTGSAVQWLRDQLGIISGAAESETLARQVDGQRRRLLRAGVLRAVRAVLALATPAARSSGCPGSTPTRTWPGPRWRRSATRAATSSRRWSRTPGVTLDVLKVDGGVTANDLCMQIQADILGVAGEPPVVAETTALGAAYAAGLAVGFWKNTDELREQLERGQALGAAVERRAARRPGTPAGRRPSSARWTGWRSTDACGLGRTDAVGTAVALSPQASAEALGPDGRDRARRPGRSAAAWSAPGRALDAVTRGLSVGLVEARDLACGTSSRSSKLIHGGLRYLEMLDFGLVREALHGARAAARPARPAPGPAGAVPLPADRTGSGSAPTSGPASRSTTRWPAPRAPRAGCRATGT